MAARKRTTYETQAKLSVILGAIGGVCAIAGMALILQRFDFQNFWVKFAAKGPRFFAIAGSLFLALLASGAGFFIGLHSAEQRRNTQSKLSWTGFFLSSAVVLITLCTGVFFYFTKYPVRQE